MIYKILKILVGGGEERVGNRTLFKIVTLQEIMKNQHFNNDFIIL